MGVQMLKHSQFNHVVDVPGENAWAVHNFATGATERLDVLQKALFDAAPTLPASSEVVRSWRAAGFLVPSDVDEPAILRELAEKRALEHACGSGPFPLTLTICVTEACNFACPYCFQKTGTRHMSEEVQRALVRFVEGRLATGRHDRLEVDWFGGEPLLALDVVEHLSGQFMRIAQRHEIPYRAMMHTNGYFLNQQAVDVLERCSVRNVLVTIDGDRASHDAKRHLQSGGPTYDRIVANLRAIRTSMRIIVRCNLHESNVESLPALVQLVEDIACETGNQMRVSPAAVRWAPANAERDDATELLSFERYARILSQYGRVEKADPFRPVLSACGMTRLNELQIQADGAIFPNCHNAPDIPPVALGSVLDGEPIDWGAAARRIFGTLGFPDERSECLSCKLLVCCHGGCHGLRWVHDGLATCSEYRADPDSYVLGCLAQTSGGTAL